MVDELDGEVSKNRREVADAVERLAKARDKLAQTLSIARWVDRFPHKPRLLPPAALANADRFRAAVEAATAEAAIARQWCIPSTAALDLVLAQDVAVVCPLHMAKLVRPSFTG